MRYLTVLVAVLATSLCAADVASACSCARVPPGDLLRQSDGAVVARLLAVRPINGENDTASSSDPFEFVYRTGKVVKGRTGLAKGRRLAILTPRTGASCGLSGAPGELTGLFLTRNGGRWTSSSCQQITASQMRALRASKGGGRVVALCSDGLALVVRAVASTVSKRAQAL